MVKKIGDVFIALQQNQDFYSIYYGNPEYLKSGFWDFLVGDNDVCR